MGNDTRRCHYSDTYLLRFNFVASNLACSNNSLAAFCSLVVISMVASTAATDHSLTQKALDLANENRDLNQQTQLDKIAEAKRKLAEAKAKRDADNK